MFKFLFQKGKIKELESLLDRMEKSLENQQDEIKSLNDNIFNLKGYELKYKVAKLYIEDQDELLEFISLAEKANEKKSCNCRELRFSALREHADAQVRGLQGCRQGLLGQLGLQSIF